MHFKKSTSQDSASLVDLTPMIDIVFLLIIFFMLAAQTAQKAKLQLSLPHEIGEQLAEQQTSNLIININEYGELVLETDEPPVSLQTLEGRIQEAISGKHVPWQSLLIRADKNASTTTLNEVLQILNKHGLSATRIATEVPR